MRTACRIAAALAAPFVVCGIVLAEEPPAPPKPGPEHKVLERFLGKWTGKGEMKPGPFGPGGPVTWTETCEWFPGGFHVVCRSEGNGPMGASHWLGIIGYDAAAKVYTYYGIDNFGYMDLSRGTRQGKVWSFSSESRIGDKTYKSRFTMEDTSDISFKFKAEMSEDGVTWSTMMTGESSK